MKRQGAKDWGWKAAAKPVLKPTGNASVDTAVYGIPTPHGWVDLRRAQGKELSNVATLVGVSRTFGETDELLRARLLYGVMGMSGTMVPDPEPPPRPPPTTRPMPIPEPTKVPWWRRLFP